MRVCSGTQFGMSDPSPSPETALAAALRARLAIIADRASYQRDPQAHFTQLQTASEKITALAAQLPRPVPPRLAHFLERCSYDKALAWLEEERMKKKG